MRSAILATGSELVSGVTRDSNAFFLSAKLYDLGAPVSEALLVPDDRALIGDSAQRLAASADMLFITGGLGPTADDFTSEVIAAAFGRDLVEDAGALETLRTRFQTYGITLTENNRKQAMLPQGAIILPNDNGSACGYYFEHEKTTIFVMPGVPREMQPMFENIVTPILADRWGLADTARRRILKTIGIAESKLDHMLAGVDVEGVELGFRYHFPENHITLKSSADEDPEGKLDHAENLVRAQLGEAVFTTGEKLLEELVGEALVESGLKLALAESCTGGLIAKRLTDVAGSSEYFLSSAVSYSYPEKTRLLGVRAESLEQHGAVSEVVASEMVLGALASGAGLALSVTGVAGPGGGSPDKPVGTTFIALCFNGEAPEVNRYRFWGGRSQVRLAASSTALNLLRRAIRHRTVTA